MAYKLIAREYTRVANLMRDTYVLDSKADGESLPKASPGSMAMVAADGGAIFMVNASGEWKVWQDGN